MLLMLFFFQAEDGIRDYKVTGVQTCALPISNLILPADDRNIIVTIHTYDPFYFTHQGASWTRPQTDTKGIIFPGPPATPLERSEERRVGREGRWRWWQGRRVKRTKTGQRSE